MTPICLLVGIIANACVLTLLCWWHMPGPAFTLAVALGAQISALMEEIFE